MNQPLRALAALAENALSLIPRSPFLGVMTPISGLHRHHVHM